MILMTQRSVLLTCLLLGCISSSLITTLVDAAEENNTVHVVGRLTDEGIECQALRDKDDKLYTLTGELEGFKAGDKVMVEGRVVALSMCMQGTTLNVESLEKVES